MSTLAMFGVYALPHSEASQLRGSTTGLMRVSREAATAREAERIENLLAAAAAHLEIGRVVDSPGSNALEAYRQVLGLDANDPTAKQGLEKIASVYEEVARETLAGGNVAGAKLLLIEGLQAIPNHTKLRLLLDKVLIAK